MSLRPLLLLLCLTLTAPALAERIVGSFATAPDARPRLNVTFRLDGGASWSTDAKGIAGTGDSLWDVGNDDSYTLLLDAGGTRVISFEFEGEALVATEWERDVFGERALRLYRSGSGQ